MRIEPDAGSAESDQRALIRIVRALLERVTTAGPAREAVRRALPPSADRADHGIPPPLYPGLVATAQRLQLSLRSPTPTHGPAPAHSAIAEPGPDAVVAAAAERALAADGRAEVLPGGWRVDLTPDEPHLAESVRRALAQIPPRTDREPSAKVILWSEPDRAMAHRAAALIHRVWPRMLAEMASVVRQLALLDGPSINGFTDFATHGAIYVNRTRLESGRDGIPAHCRLAEALVHEATHNRCNVASVGTPFLTADSAGVDEVDTPLRADPRPLSGLFQQIVVIARSVRLYDLALDGPAEPGRDALVARRDLLLAQGARGVRTAHAHTAGLSEAGRAVVDEADALLRDPVSAGESPR